MIEFLLEEGNGPTDIHWCLVNVYQADAVDASAGWVGRCESGDRDLDWALDVHIQPRPQRLDIPPPVLLVLEEHLCNPPNNSPVPQG